MLGGTTCLTPIVTFVGGCRKEAWIVVLCCFTLDLFYHRWYALHRPVVLSIMCELANTASRVYALVFSPGGRLATGRLQPSVRGPPPLVLIIIIIMTTSDNINIHNSSNNNNNSYLKRKQYYRARVRKDTIRYGNLGYTTRHDATTQPSEAGYYYCCHHYDC